MRGDIDRFLSAIESERGFSYNTVIAYRNDLGQFVAFLQGEHGEGEAPRDGTSPRLLRSWQDLTDNCLHAYLQSLHDRRYAASTVARKTAALRSFFQFLSQEGVLGDDPSTRVIPPRVDTFLPRSISPSEMARLLQQPCQCNGERSNRPESLRDRAMLETLYATGMRVTELVSLDLGDVDQAEIRVRCGTDSARERRVPLGETARGAIENYLANGRPHHCPRDGDALFLNRRGKRLTRQGFWLILKSYAEQANIADVTPRTLRHTFATQAIRQGVELRHVQHLLGHVSISTTQVYRRLANAPQVIDEEPATDLATQSRS